MSAKASNALFGIFAAALVVVVTLQAVDGFRAPAAPPAPPVSMSSAGGGGTIELPIAQFAFPAGEVKVPVGTKAVWRNTDGTRHTVTADDGAFDSGKLMADQTFEFTFAAPGTYAYSCIIHASMKAQVTVIP